MLNLFLGLVLILSIGVSIYGVILTQRFLRVLDSTQETLRKARIDIAQLQPRVREIESILTAAPRDMIDVSVLAAEWKAAMLELPEDSPKRKAYADRLRSIGAL